MPIVKQNDYVQLDEKEIQEALAAFVLEKYNREVEGKFFIFSDRDTLGSAVTTRAKADLKR